MRGRITSSMDHKCPQCRTDTATILLVDKFFVVGCTSCQRQTKKHTLDVGAVLAWKNQEYNTDDPIEIADTFY